MQKERGGRSKSKNKVLSSAFKKALEELSKESRLLAMVDGMLEENPNLTQEEAYEQAKKLLQEENFLTEGEENKNNG